MAEGQLKRIQPDLVEEIENCDGGNFSEKLRTWKLREVEQTLETVENLTGGNMPLTTEDLQQSVEEAIRNIQK